MQIQEAIGVILLGISGVSAVVLFWQNWQKRRMTKNNTIPDPTPELAENDPSALRAALKAEDWRVRQEAVRAIGESGNEALIPDLMQMFNDSDSDVRQEAEKALVRYRQTVVMGLVEKLGDSSTNIREAAANTLGEIGANAAVPHLIEHLDDQSAWVRIAVARALEKINDKTAVAALIDHLDDSDSDVQTAVRDALRKIGTPQAKRALRGSS